MEPRSVLYHERSPSPPVSTSTRSSSVSGGGGSTYTGGVTAVSENLSQKSVEKCGIGVDDWETMFFASAALLSQEQAFLRWIMGDVDNLSVPKLHHHQPFSSQQPAAEFDVPTTDVGFDIVDPVLELEPLGGISVVATPSTASLPHSGILYQSSKNNRFTGSSQLLYQNSRQG
ncbi:hypothetical protein KSP39_PZI005664 [Platanthera zijinensis]|uniref:Uncharacterized protein n=1 Tax=Platanthera zijinensis TaxID=2320716 RepID=A0AAP0GAR3_9ASPA